MNKFLNKAGFWIFTVSRGKSLPMSLSCCLCAFVLSLKLNSSADVLYGLLSIAAVISAHLGANLFDDVIDAVLKSPKQECKTRHLKDGSVSIKTIAAAAFLHFAFSLAAGAFLFLKCGVNIIYIALPAALIILLYPKLNHFASGEAAIGACFGVLLFSGINYAMAQNFNMNILLISIPVSLLVSAAAYTHSLMDYDFDLKSGKKTLCVLLGSKKRALAGLGIIYSAVFTVTILLVLKNILPVLSLAVFMLIPEIVKLYKSMQNYIKNPEDNVFWINFKKASNISLHYNIILTAVFLIEL